MHPLSCIFARAGALVVATGLLASSAQAAPPMKAGEVSGRYAVLRDAKDTGCMVTLSATPRGKGFRAQLAPACRDQGIVVFDPVGWWLERGKLHLQARKGHNIALGYEDGVWTREGEKPLGLKKI